MGLCFYYLTSSITSWSGSIGKTSSTGSTSFISDCRTFLSTTLTHCPSSIFSYSWFEASPGLSVSWSLNMTFFLSFLIRVWPLSTCLFWDCSFYSVLKPDQNKKCSHVFSLFINTILMMSFMSPWWKTDCFVWSLCSLTLHDIFCKLFKKKKGRFILDSWLRCWRNLKWYLNTKAHLPHRWHSFVIFW